MVEENHNEGWIQAAELKLLRAVNISNKEDGRINENTGKTLTANKCDNM